MSRHRVPRPRSRGPLLLVGSLVAWGVAAPALLGQASASDLNCSDFTTQTQAQAVLNADRSDPNHLDANGNGVACESLPRGHTQVQGPVTGAVDAGDGSYP